MNELYLMDVYINITPRIKFLPWSFVISINLHVLVITILYVFCNVIPIFQLK